MGCSCSAFAAPDWATWGSCFPLPGLSFPSGTAPRRLNRGAARGPRVTRRSAPGSPGLAPGAPWRPPAPRRCAGPAAVTHRQQPPSPLPAPAFLFPIAGLGATPGSPQPNPGSPNPRAARWGAGPFPLRAEPGLAPGRAELEGAARFPAAPGEAHFRELRRTGRTHAGRFRGASGDGRQVPPSWPGAERGCRSPARLACAQAPGSGRAPPAAVRPRGPRAAPRWRRRRPARAARWPGWCRSRRRGNQRGEDPGGAERGAGARGRGAPPGLARRGRRRRRRTFPQTGGRCSR